jgi:hypothetical protein
MRIWRRVAPSARRSPISLRRSRTEITMMLATPTAPTSGATAQPEEQGVERALGLRLSCQRGRWPRVILTR